MERTSDLSTREAGELVGVSHSTVASWRREAPVRVNAATRRALVEWLERGSAAPANGSTPEEWPEPEPDDPDDVRQLLAFFSAGPEGFRRMARHIPLSDLAKAALKTALDDGMPDEHFQRLYARLKHLLPGNER